MSPEWIMLAESIRLSEQQKDAIKRELSELQEITSRAAKRSAQLKGAQNENTYHFNGNDRWLTLGGSDLQDLGRKERVAEAIESVAPQPKDDQR